VSPVVAADRGETPCTRFTYSKSNVSVGNVGYVIAFVVVAGCVTSRNELVRELAPSSCGAPVRVTSVGVDDYGRETLRADACGDSTFYECSSPPRSAHSCCEQVGVIGRLGTGAVCR
jgi:hypothetical protein